MLKKDFFFDWNTLKSDDENFDWKNIVKKWNFVLYRQKIKTNEKNNVFFDYAQHIQQIEIAIILNELKIAKKWQYNKFIKIKKK